MRVVEVAGLGWVHVVPYGARDCSAYWRTYGQTSRQRQYGDIYSGKTAAPSPFFD